jgi:hypothetical protein
MILAPSLVTRAALVGSVLQLALSLLHHFVTSLTPVTVLYGHMMLAATAGYLYGLILGQGYARGALGGAIAGGLSVVPAYGLSLLLGDSNGISAVTLTTIAIGTGAVGGAFGQMGAILKKLGY